MDRTSPLGLFRRAEPYCSKDGGSCAWGFELYCKKMAAWAAAAGGEAMSRPRNWLERGLLHPCRASPQHCGSSSCQEAFCVIPLTQVVSKMLLQFAGGTKQPGISLFGGWRDGGRGASKPPCHCRGADTAAPALLTLAVIRSAPGRCKSFQPSCRYPPSAEQEKRRPLRQDTAPSTRGPVLAFYLPLQASLQLGNFLWYSFDLLDGNCLPNGNLRPGDGGEGGGALAFAISAGKLEGAARSPGFMRQRAGNHRAVARRGLL